MRRKKLAHLVHHMASRLVGDEAGGVVNETLAAIERHLGPAYPWPGNVRELEQCVRNVLVRREYRPHQEQIEARQIEPAVGADDAQPASDPSAATDPHRQLAADSDRRRLRPTNYSCAYCTIMYAQCGSYVMCRRTLES